MSGDTGSQSLPYVIDHGCGVRGQAVQGVRYRFSVSGRDPREIEGSGSLVERYGQMLEKHRKYLHRVARSRLGRRLRAKMDPADVVQGAFLQAFAKKEQFRGETETEFAAWLRQILLNEVAQATRWWKTGARDIGREEALELSEQTLRGILAADGSPAKALIREEQVTRLQRAVDGLPLGQRRAIELHYFNGFTVDEVGIEMGRSAASVMGLVYRGVRTLQKRTLRWKDWRRLD